MFTPVQLVLLTVPLVMKLENVTLMLVPPFIKSMMPSLVT